MFVCPSLGEDVVIVVATLLHEMIHASVGIECKHSGAFRGLAKEFGLAGKMTHTFAEEGTELHRTLEVIVGRLGPYPHAPMSKKGKRGGKKTNGWVRMKSLNADGYRVTISPRMMEEHGLPRDPWGDEMVPV